MSHFQTLLNKVNEVNDLEKAFQILSWDRETYMPKAGMNERIQQMTTIRRLIHRMSTTDEYGEMIGRASAELNGADPNGFEKRLIALLDRQYKRQRQLPPAMVKRAAIASGKGREAWVQARASNDFAHFRPHLEEIVAILQEQAEIFGYEEEKYDAFIRFFEHGMTTADVRRLFNAVKKETKPLLDAIQERGTAIDDALLHQSYPREKQIEFARYIAKAVGYDFERGHLGTVVHPFATSFSRNDARITSRWYPDFLNPGLFGTLHESGHAMYEQGTHPDFSRTPLARGGSMALHESQSRSVENIIGRSLGFWRVHYPQLQAIFPDQLNGHSVEAFHRAINKVQPSYIRVEADEVTYNLHIILRFELEQAMLNGDLVVADLPTAWNDKFTELIGITPPDNTQGCLQDVHWSRPLFGYFPTYALGNLYGAQFYEAMCEQDPTIGARLENGDPMGVVDWLRENIHQHGSKFPPNELVMNTTGKPLSHEPFMRYINKKFTDIYAL